MYRKLRIFKRKGKKKGGSNHIINIAYLDSCVLGDLILRNVQGKYKIKKIQFIAALLRKYNIKDIIITHKLFIEMIGQGKFRNEIWHAPEISSAISKSKKKIKDKIKNGQAISEEDIKHHQTLLEAIFREKIKVIFPQKGIYTQALFAVREYPFHKLFYALKSKILIYAQELSESEEKYNAFITTLVEDSVIRYLFLLVINKDEYPKQAYKNLELAFIKVLNTILLEYVKHGLLHTNLILLTAAEEDFNSSAAESKRLIRAQDDNADAEMPPLFFYGHNKDGIYYRVIVFSQENKDTIRKRIDCYSKGINTIFNEDLRYSNILKQQPQDLLMGKSIFLDLKNFTNEEIKFDRVKLRPDKMNKRVKPLIVKKIWAAEYH